MTEPVLCIWGPLDGQRVAEQGVSFDVGEGFRYRYRAWGRGGRIDRGVYILEGYADNVPYEIHPDTPRKVREAGGA